MGRVGAERSGGPVRLTPAEAVAMVRELRALGATSFRFGSFAVDLAPLEAPTAAPEVKPETPFERATRQKLDALGSV